MKFLIDQLLPNRAEKELQLRGWDAVYARTVGLAASSDEEIVQWCRANKRIIVTSDADFPMLVALSGSKEPSVIRIRMQGLDAKDVAEIVARTGEAHAIDLAEGALITIREHAIRVRRLPISRSDEET